MEFTVPGSRSNYHQGPDEALSGESVSAPVPHQEAWAVYIEALALPVRQHQRCSIIARHFS
jgi:hypothetical protein